MHALKTFAIDTGAEVLAADRLEAEGRASCLLLHGGAATSERSHWLVLRQNLARHGIGTVAMDFSGHGESSARTPNSLSKRYDEAIAALQYLDEDEPRAVIGISMSGEIAVRLAADPNNRIRRLVTLVGAAYDSAAFEYRPRSRLGLARTAGTSRPPRQSHLSRHPGLTAIIESGRSS